MKNNKFCDILLIIILISSIILSILGIIIPSKELSGLGIFLMVASLLGTYNN